MGDGPPTHAILITTLDVTRSVPVPSVNNYSKVVFVLLFVGYRMTVQHYGILIGV